MAAARKWLRRVALALIAAAAASALAFPETLGLAVQLPLLAVYSVGRMFAAYALSLVFAIAYGTTMALNKKAAVIMLPVLDILQSVPILGFFPAALVFFAAFGAPYTRPGLGAFIAARGNAGDYLGIVLGLAVLAGVVLALDAFLWRPLSVWSERFRIETTGTGQPVPRVPSPYERLSW